MAENRSADAGILGFTYQFLQTAIKILSLDESGASFTIEGIEDLDVSTTDEDLLVQYKYHEGQAFTLSTIDKPIALMYKHFIDDRQETPDFYVLFSYFGIKRENEPAKDNITIKGKDELEKLLSYSNASKILKGLEWTDINLEGFLKVLRFEDAEKFDDAKDKLIVLIKEKFGVSETEGQALYFANAIYFINQLATKKNIIERKISKQQFIDFLSSNSQVVQYEIINRLYGQKEYLALLKKYILSKNIKRNTSSYIIHLKDIKINTSRLIIDLANKFLTKGSTRTIYPVTFIIHDKTENLIELKKDLLKINAIEKCDLLFNDGHEFYYFQPEIFTNSPLLSLTRNGQQVQRASYNYRLLSFETYYYHKSNISLDNPFHFIINDSVEATELNIGVPVNSLRISSIDDTDLLLLLGG